MKEITINTSSIIDRIRQIIDYKHLSERAFCKEIGVANGFVSKVSDVGCSKLNKILYTYPELNPIWLLTGRGEMLCHADGEPTTAQAEPIIIYRDNPDKEEIIALQREHIKLLKEQLTLSPARLDLNVPSTESTPIPSLAGHKRAKTTEKPH